MKYLGYGLLLLLSPACMACVIEPSIVVRQLETDNPSRVIARLWDGHVCEMELLDGLASGKADWLRLAVALQPHADAWAAESLHMSLGTAMQNAPSRVLPLVGLHGFGDGPCVPTSFDDSPLGIRRDARTRLRAQTMFRRFLKTSLAPQARRCLSALSKFERSE